MDCPNCGHRGLSGAAYCEQCGAALRAPGSQVMPASPPVLAPAATLARPAQESRYWAIGAHLSALAGGFLGGLPAFLGPLVVWLVRKDVDPYAAAHGRAALNFNLSVLVYAAALVVLTLVTFGVGALLTVPAGIALGLGWLVLSIVGTVKAANDQVYRYPLTIRFVR